MGGQWTLAAESLQRIAGIRARPTWRVGRPHLARMNRALVRFNAFDPQRPSYQWPVLIGPRGTGEGQCCSVSSGRLG